MKQIKFAGILSLLLVPVLGWTQATSTSSTGTSTTSVGTSAPKKWGASVGVVASRDAIHAAEEKEDVAASTEYDFSLSYKFNSDWSTKVMHRVFYDVATNSQYQGNAQYGNLRIYLTQSNMGIFSAKKDASSFSYRVTLPTTYEALNGSHQAGMLAFIPVLAWDLSPSLSINYDGLYQVAFHSDQNKALEAKAPSSKWGATMRNWAMFFNEASLKYAFGDTFSVYQTLGYEYDIRNANKDAGNPSEGINMVGSYSNIGTGVNWNPSKMFSASVGVAQYVPYTDNSVSVDPNLKLNYYSQFSLYRPEQSQYQLTATVKY